LLIYYNSLADLVNAPENGKDMFGCVCQTDGFGVTFIFTRPKRTSTTEVRLELEDSDQPEVEEHFLPVTVDPGRNQVFTAAVGYNSNDHEIRRCSEKERICYTGHKRRQLIVERLKVQRGIKDIETNIPSPKTVDPTKFSLYLTYILQNLDTLFSFYSHRSAAFRFHDYQGRQRTNAEVANILLQGGKKYNKRNRKKTKKNRKQRKKKAKAKKLQYPDRVALKQERKNARWRPQHFNPSALVPLVVFGDGMKNKDTVKMKGHVSGTTGLLYQEIQRRQNQFLAALLDINEFRTSRVSISLCHSYLLSINHYFK
jgi:hypothetical protein